jgi:type I restriction enzyme S subunit
MNIADSIYCIGRGLAAIRGDNRQTDTEFLFHALAHLKPTIYGIALAGGSTFPNISKANIETLELSLPPLDEQRQIARLLSAVQRAIERQQRLIALTAELKKTLMHKLFTEGARDEARKQTEIGPVPESWTVTTLGELCKKPNGRIQTGPFGSILHKEEYQSVGAPIVNPIHLVNNQIDHKEVPRVGESAAQRLCRYRLRVNDLLFGRRGDIGRHAIVSEAEANWFCGTGCFIVRVSDPRVDAQFLNAFLSKEHVINWLQTHAAGVIMPNLSNKVLERLPISFPDRREQAATVAALGAVDAKASAHARSAAAFNDLFRTLLHQLMTAEIRVHDLDLSALDGLVPEPAEVA